MHQVFTFLWICGLYIGLSVMMAAMVATYDPRRPHVTTPASVSRDEREAKWCSGLKTGGSEGPIPAVVGFEGASRLRDLLQHATGLAIGRVQEAKYFGRYSKAVLVLGPPGPEGLPAWNSLYMGWLLNFKGPKIAVNETSLTSDPRGQLTRVLQFLGRNASTVECALSRLQPPRGAFNASVLQGPDAQPIQQMVFTALTDLHVQI